MLTELTIDNLALLKKLHISFQDNMTCLTGETGAGKSIMLDAINLVLGGKCNPSLFNKDSKPINISATFNIRPNNQAYNWLINQKYLGTLEADTAKDSNKQNKSIDIIINRQITKSTSIKSKATINKIPANLQQLKQLGNFLIYIHGQHEHLNLLKENNQLKILDNYGKLTKLSSKVKKLYNQWASCQQELKQLYKLQADYQAKKQLLEFKITELQTAELKPNEWQDINERYQWLSNQQQYIHQLNQAYFILEEGDEQQASVNSMLNQILNITNNIKANNEKLNNITDFISQALIQAQEASNELKYFLNNQETDQSLLNKLDKRLSELHNLARKYKTEPELLLNLLNKCEQDLAKLGDVEENITKLEQDIKVYESNYYKLSANLSKQRQATAVKLSSELTSLLKKLRMADAEFSIFLQPINDGIPKPNGLEQIIFLIKTNSGDNMKPLNQGVSGGELSRVALATQVITAQVEGTPSLIFDEVDVGIGGGTAEIVGKLLRKMGHSTQVMCITHLAQVAAQAEHHIRVSKAVVKKETVTTIENLNTSDRIKELARMIGGLTITKQTTAHAKELLEHAGIY